MIDDTVVDELKIIKHLALMERKADKYEEYVIDKNSNFQNIKQLLLDSKFLIAPFVEKKTNFQQHSDSFLKAELLNYEKL